MGLSKQASLLVGGSNPPTERNLAISTQIKSNQNKCSSSLTQDFHCWEVVLHMGEMGTCRLFLTALLESQTYDRQQETGRVALTA